MSNDDIISHEQAVTSTFWGGKRLDLPNEYKIFFSEVFQKIDLESRIKEIRNLEEKNFPQSIPESGIPEKVIQTL